MAISYAAAHPERLTRLILFGAYAARRRGPEDDEMFDAFVTRAPTYALLGTQLRERYAGVLDRVALYGDATRVGPDKIAALAASL